MTLYDPRLLVGHLQIALNAFDRREVLVLFVHLASEHDVGRRKFQQSLHSLHNILLGDRIDLLGPFLGIHVSAISQQMIPDILAHHRSLLQIHVQSALELVLGALELIVRERLRRQLPNVIAQDLRRGSDEGGRHQRAQTRDSVQSREQHGDFAGFEPAVAIHHVLAITAAMKTHFIKPAVHPLARTARAEHLAATQNHLQEIQRDHVLGEPSVGVESQIHFHHVHSWQLREVAPSLHDPILLRRRLSLLRVQRVEHARHRLRSLEAEEFVCEAGQLVVVHVHAHQTHVGSHVVLRPKPAERLGVAAR